MIDLKLKLIEEKIYEQILNTVEECELPLMFVCSVLKNVESKFQEKTIADLSYRLLKKEQENLEKEKTINQNAKDLEN